MAYEPTIIRPSPADGRATIIVVGVPGSGISMLAAVLTALGIDFRRAEEIHQANELLSLNKDSRAIALFRDPAAIAKRNEISMGVEFASALQAASIRTAEMVDFAKKAECPVMLVSYEDSLASREEFVEAVAEFAGLNPSRDHLQAAVLLIENGSREYLQSLVRH